MHSMTKDRTPRKEAGPDSDHEPDVEPIEDCTAGPPQPERGDASHDAGPALLCW